MERTTANLQLGRLHPSAPTGLWHALSSWIERIRREREMRRAIDTVMTMDDRMLADIGIDRSQAEHAVRHGRLPHWTEQPR